MKYINLKKFLKGVSVGLALLTLVVIGQNFVDAYQPIFGQTEAQRNNRFLGQSGNARSEQAGLLDISRVQLAPLSE
ncbi:MAG: hypothetical protein MRY57_04025, partial [Candidatus Pacebacteria bacterium]|nr:hypothetical protein [Candidatus Paceibacterota bacterium]